jgi:hypothetical protein
MDTVALSPICPTHPESQVHLNYSGDDVVVLCEVGEPHLLNTCSRIDFEIEKREAKQELDKMKQRLS